MTRSLAVTTALLMCGCEFFEVQDDGGFDESAGETSSFEDSSSDTDEPPPPPSEGFRVFPKFMLQDLPAIVTIEAGDGSSAAIACALDGAPEGGYVCDASQIMTVLVTIRVDKDGFETAVRSAEVLPNQIQGLEVHLIVEGGPTGTWSECVNAGEFDSCAALCEAQMLSCMVTSCATELEQWPVATLELFTSLDCIDTLDVKASSCEEPLAPSADVASMRCCCSG